MIHVINELPHHSFTKQAIVAMRYEHALCPLYHELPQIRAPKGILHRIYMEDTDTFAS